MADNEIKDTSEEIESVTEGTDVAESDGTDVAAVESKKPENVKKEASKPGFFARVGASIKKFWKTMKSELKKVTWYSRKQTFNSTLLVLVCIVVFGVVLGLLDFGFSKGLEGLANLF